MALPLSIFRNNGGRIYLTTPLLCSSEADYFTVYSSASPAGPFTSTGRSFPNAEDRFTPRSALAIITRAELGASTSDTIYFRITSTKSGVESDINVSETASAQPEHAANYDTFGEGFHEVNQILGFDNDDSVWRRIQVDDEGRLVVTGISGGGGAGDASAANQLVQIDLAQQQLDKICEILDAVQCGTGGGSFTLFGLHYHFAAEEAVSTMTGPGNYLEKLSLTTCTLSAGKYRIGWSYSWNIDSTANDFMARIQIDDTNTIMNHQEEPTDSSGQFSTTGTDQKHTSSGFVIQDLVGQIKVDLDWTHNGPPGTEASIWDARIEIWRVS